MIESFFKKLIDNWCLFFVDKKVLVYNDLPRKQSKKHKTPLTSVFIGGCPANTCTVHIPQIMVPPVPATDISSSKILHITYELKVCLEICLFDLDSA